jgi:signal transduction histidine kinase
MSILKNTTIRHKLTLIIMFTCITALVMAASAFIVWEQITFRNSMVRNLSIQAAMTAENCKAALAFEDAADAEETLKALRAESSIIFGCVYTADGKVFAKYSRDNTVTLPPPQKDGHRFHNNSLTVFNSIILDGEKIGTLCLRSDLHLLSIMLKSSAGISTIILLFVSLMAYLMSSGLKKIISGPLLKLAYTTKIISLKKDYSLRVEKQSEDEIGTLIDAFNQMLRQVQQHDAALLDANKQLTTEITERKKAEATLEEVNKDLEATVRELSRSNRELQDFAHITAHDLKAPLRAIGTLADWLADSYADKFDSEGKEQISLLVGRAQRMSKLIDGILSYSEVTRTRQKAQKVNLNTLVTEIIRGIELPDNIEIIIENELPTVVYEQTRMMQVFQNLLTNAVKYMDKPEGHIEINCLEHDGFWKFSIADNGPGIEEKYYEKIFKIFQTLSPRDEIESTGIGLPLIKKIIENYDGEIWVESTVGIGSTFFFTLPVSPDVLKNSRRLLFSAEAKN